MAFEVALNSHSLGITSEPFRQAMLETLEQYEVFVARPEDPLPLERCKTAVDTLRGACTMLEMPGAQMLTEELSAFIGAILDCSLLPKEPVLAAGSRAVIALQQYLDFIQLEGRDLPPLAADPVNELRRARKQAMVTESAIYAETIPHFVRDSELESASHPQTGEALVKTAASLRHMYQLGLLAVLRDDRPLVHFELMQRAAHRLADMMVPGEWQRFWKLAEITLSCFANGGLGLSRTRKQLFMQLEQQFKQFAKSAQALHQPVPELLAQELVFMLMLSSWREGDVGRFLAQADIGEAPVLDTQLRELRARLMGPGPDTLKATASEVLTDLYAVADTLEVVALQGRMGEDERAHLLDNLRRSSAVLSVVGQGADADTLMNAATKVSAELDDNISAQLADIANDLTLVKQHLENIASAGRPDADPTMSAQAALLREMEADIAAVKRDIVDLMAEELTLSGLADSASQLQSVAGSCALIGLERSEAMLDQLAATLSGMARAEQMPAREQLEAVADVLIGIEYYLSEFALRDPDQTAALDMADNSLQLLATINPV